MPVPPNRSDIRLTLLGTPDARNSMQENLLPRGRKARALLFLLGLAGGEHVSRARLASLLWSRVPMNQARASLRQALHELSQSWISIGQGRLVFSRDSVALDVSNCWIDVLEASQATAETPEGLDLLCRPLLEGTDGLDPAFDTWLATEREALRIRGLATAREALDKADRHQAVEAARRVLRLEPSDVAAARLLAEQLSISGDRANALKVLDKIIQLLEQEGRVADPKVLEMRWRLQAGEDIREGDQSDPRAETIRLSPYGRGSRIRIGVPPLTILGPNIDAYLAQSLAGEITTALTRFRWLSLGDPATLGVAKSPLAAATKMGLDCVLLGSMQNFGSRIRIVARLVDLRVPGEVLWSGRFDWDGQNPLILQDEIAASVAARLEAELLLIEARRLTTRARSELSPLDVMLKAMPGLHSLERTAFFEAQHFLEQAIKVDPNHALSHAWYAWWHLFLVGQGWAIDHPAALLKAEMLATRAVTLDPSDALSLTVRGHVLAYLYHLPEEGRVLHDRALALNPNLALAWALSGLSHCYLGRHEKALRHLEHYSELVPLHPLGFFLNAAKPVPLMLMGRYSEAAESSQAAAALHPRFSFPLRPWLASLGWLGQRDRAATVCNRLLLLEPGLTVARALARAPLQPADRELYAEGLRRGGLPPH